MKKLFAIMVIAAAFTACTDNAASEETTKDTPEVVAPVETDTTVIQADTAVQADSTAVK